MSVGPAYLVSVKIIDHEAVYLKRETRDTVFIELEEFSMLVDEDIEVLGPHPSGCIHGTRDFQFLVTRRDPFEIRQGVDGPRRPID